MTFNIKFFVFLILNSLGAVTTNPCVNITSVDVDLKQVTSNISYIKPHDSSYAEFPTTATWRLV